MLSAVFHPRSLLEIEAARRWYERIRPELGNRFAAHVDDAIESVLDNPMMFAVAIDSIRRVPVSSFPYHVYYEVFADRLMIFAVFHFHRNPQTVSTEVTGRKAQS
jgi:toxin ParE1/3/4